MAPRGKRTLSEHESKRMLAAYGLPLPREAMANGREEAVRAAGEIGWPVALKANDPRLAHKSEAGAVALNLSGPEELGRALDDMEARLGFAPQGWLVAEMVRGNRELVLGASKQISFGPCVMLGLGGVFTEVLDDVVFRMAPMDRGEALAMMDEIKAARLLGPFRGQAAVDREALALALVGLSNFCLARPEVAEVDINPLIIRPDGRIVAVDALVVLEDGYER